MALANLRCMNVLNNNNNSNNNEHRYPNYIVVWVHARESACRSVQPFCTVPPPRVQLTDRQTTLGCVSCACVDSARIDLR